MPNTLFSGLTLNAPSQNVNLATLMSGTGLNIIQPLGGGGNTTVLQPVTGGTLTPANPTPTTTTTTTTPTTTTPTTGTTTTTPTGGATTTTTPTPTTTATTPITKQWWFWAIVAAVAIGGGYFLYKKMGK